MSKYFSLRNKVPLVFSYHHSNVFLGMELMWLLPICTEWNFRSHLTVSLGDQCSCPTLKVYLNCVTLFVNYGKFRSPLDLLEIKRTGYYYQVHSQ